MVNPDDGQPGSSRPRRAAPQRRQAEAESKSQVKGPTSALTDFLASHNISAAEIRRAHQQRAAQEEPAGPASMTGPGRVVGTASDDQTTPAPAPTTRKTRSRAKGKGRATKKPKINNDNDGEASLEPEEPDGDGVDDHRDDDDDDEDEDDDTDDDPKGKGKARKPAKGKGTKKAITNGKTTAKGKGKEKEKQKQKVNGKKKDDDGSSSDSDDDDENDVRRHLGPKVNKKAPGQRTKCEACNKLFTVSPYTCQGPDGGLLCGPCGKVHKKEDAKKQKQDAPKKSAIPRRRRQRFESSKLDGETGYGVKSLQKLCLEMLVKHAADVEDFGDLNDEVRRPLSHIYTKNRALRSDTVGVFCRPDLTVLEFQDCAYLETADYTNIISTCPNLEKLLLTNASQFKDVNLDLLTEKCDNLKFVHLYSANLVSSEAWIRFFEKRGHQLEGLRLKWLDSTMNDDVLAAIAECCPNLKRLKLSMCSDITVNGLIQLEKLTNLEHFSLDLPNLPDPKSKDGTNTIEPASTEATPNGKKATKSPKKRAGTTEFDPLDIFPKQFLNMESNFPWHLIGPDDATIESFEALEEAVSETPAGKVLSWDDDKKKKSYITPRKASQKYNPPTPRATKGSVLSRKAVEPPSPVYRAPFQFSSNEPEILSRLIFKIGAKLVTLSLASIPQLVDDQLLEDIARTCHRLRKFRLTDADNISDEALSFIFDRSLLPPSDGAADEPGSDDGPANRHTSPLIFVDMSGCRSWEPRNADEPDMEDIGAFGALPTRSEVVASRPEGPRIGGSRYEPGSTTVGARVLTNRRDTNGVSGAAAAQQPDAVDSSFQYPPYVTASSCRGFGPRSFHALMRVSGHTIRQLNLASCDSISYRSLCDIFPLVDSSKRSSDPRTNGVDHDASAPIEKFVKLYPELQSVDLSFCPSVNSPVLQALVHACPNVSKIVAIGCFAAWNPSFAPTKKRADTEAGADDPMDGVSTDQRREIYKSQVVYVPRTCALIGPQDYAIVDDRVAHVVRADERTVTLGKEVVDVDAMVVDKENIDVNHLGGDRMVDVR